MNRIMTFSLLLMMLVSIGLYAQTETKQKLSVLRGEISTDDTGHYYLATSAPEAPIYRLLLAPKAALDSLGFMPAIAKGPATVEAKITSNLLIVKSITIADKEYQLRNGAMEPLWTEPATTNVVTRECIGCRLCVSQCPVGAISMKSGKAVIDKTLCVECGICIEGKDRFRGCPVGAIKK